MPHSHTNTHEYRGQIQGYSQPSREERQKFNLRRPSHCQAMQQVWPVWLQTKTNTGFVTVSVCLCVCVSPFQMKWTTFIYLFICSRATTKKPQQIIMKIKIINHLQGTSRGSSSSRRTTITAASASADRQHTNNIAHTPRCVPRWDSDSDSTRLVARFVARFVAGIVSEICLVLLQAPCTVDAYAVNESSGDESSAG